MPELIDNPLQGYAFDIHINRQLPAPPGQRVILRKAFNDGVNIPKALWYQCRVAEDLKDALGEGILVNDELYRPNSHSTPFFGKNVRGKASLVFGLVRDSDGAKFSFKWQGDVVPRRLLELAVKHDEGVRAPKATVTLNFDDAEVWETNDVNKPKDTRGRHDISPKTGEPHPRKRLSGKRSTHRRFDRVGRCDLQDAAKTG